MNEDSGTSPSRKPGTSSSGGSTGVNNATARSASTALPPAPSGFHAIRRAMTVDESAQTRRRPLSGQSQLDGSSFESPRRRSSIYSDCSLNEARRNLEEDILNPSVMHDERHGGSSWASLPLAFALLPAVGGLFFKNGGALVTDIMLLGLAAVFLHWSVTQPWIWYHSAQQVRVREETMTEMVIDDESDGEVQSPSPSRNEPKVLDDVPEEEDKPKTSTPSHTTTDLSRRSRQSALNELYAHEVMALAACFLLPMLAAYLLHAIRGQLSRPSEGLVSNYNLSIFLLAAEIRPLSHILKLVQARTLHLQRVVTSNPYNGTSPTLSQVQDMARRLAELETRAVAGFPSAATQASNGTTEAGKQPARQDPALVREVRNAIQPELDALNRAVRRYEKKATVLAFQTESRLGAIDTRLNDAISLAAAAAKHSASQGSVFGWLAEKAMRLAMMPVHVAINVVSLPFRTITAVLRRDRGETAEKGLRDRRVAKGGASGRMSSSDRVPSRLSKR